MKPLFKRQKGDEGFAILEAMVGLLVIAFAASTVPIITRNAKRRLAFNKRRYAALMARDQMIKMLTNDSIWAATKNNAANAGASYLFNGTPGTNLAIYSNSGVNPILDAGNNASCITSFNGFGDNGQRCCDSGGTTPSAACPVKVLFASQSLCTNAQGCTPALINLQVTFNIYTSDMSDSILKGLASTGLSSGKYEIDLVRFTN